MPADEEYQAHLAYSEAKAEVDAEIQRLESLRPSALTGSFRLSQKHDGKKTEGFTLEESRAFALELDKEHKAFMAELIAP